MAGTAIHIFTFLVLSLSWSEPSHLYSKTNRTLPLSLHFFFFEETLGYDKKRESSQLWKHQ